MSITHFPSFAATRWCGVAGTQNKNSDLPSTNSWNDWRCRCLRDDYGMWSHLPSPFQLKFFSSLILRSSNYFFRYKDCCMQAYMQRRSIINILMLLSLPSYRALLCPSSTFSSSNTSKTITTNVARTFFNNLPRAWAWVLGLSGGFVSVSHVDYKLKLLPPQLSTSFHIIQHNWTLLKEMLKPVVLAVIL